MGLTFKYSRLSSLFAARDISGLPRNVPSGEERGSGGFIRRLVRSASFVIWQAPQDYLIQHLWTSSVAKVS